MAFEDVRESARESMKGLANRVQESTAYLQLMEKYQSLSPVGQKLSVAGTTFVAVLILLAVPYTFYSSSQTYVEEYEAKQQLIRDLFRASRAASSLPPAPPAISGGELQTSARAAIGRASLQPEQIGQVSDTLASIPGIPKTVDQIQLTVNLKKLNLKQVVDVGHELQNLHSMARMTGVEIKAGSPDPHYFDVVYKIVAFAAKPEASPEAAGSARKKR